MIGHPPAYTVIGTSTLQSTLRRRAHWQPVSPRGSALAAATLLFLTFSSGLGAATEPTQATNPGTNGAVHTINETVPCNCVYRGVRFDLGDQVCLNNRMATCSMVQNNTSWSFSSSPCPTAGLLQTPWLDS